MESIPQISSFSWSQLHKSLIFHGVNSTTVAERRKFLGITQMNLAELADVGISTVKDLERGKGNPSLKTLERLCTVLGFEIELRIRKTRL